MSKKKWKYVRDENFEGAVPGLRLGTVGLAAIALGYKHPAIAVPPWDWLWLVTKGGLLVVGLCLLVAGCRTYWHAIPEEGSE